MKRKINTKAPINLSALITLQNPHIKYVELTKKGFVLVDIDTQRVQGDWYNVIIDQMNPASNCVKSYTSSNGSNLLTLANAPAVGHGAFTQQLANPCSRFFVGLENLQVGKIIGLYPNPGSISIKIQSFNLSVEKIQFVSSEGKTNQPLFYTNLWENVISVTDVDIIELKPGNYFLKIGKGKNVKSISFVKE